MSVPLDGRQFADPLGALARGHDGMIVLAEGGTVPTDATAGYSPGCVWLKRAGGTFGGLYVNDGTATSCDFNLISTGGVSLAALTATAAEINTVASGILATAAELNRINKRSTRVVNVTTTPLAVTEALHDGKIITLNLASGIAVTLPVAAAGLWFRFVIGTTFTGAASIKSVSGADIMVGHATMGNDTNTTTVDWQALASNTFDTIDLFGTANSTGGLEGQEIEIIGLAANKWFVRIQGDAAGTEATPFQDTVA